MVILIIAGSSFFDYTQCRALCALLNLHLLYFHLLCQTRASGAMKLTQMAVTETFSHVVIVLMHQKKISFLD